MSAESAALVRSWPVGDRTVTLTVPRSRKGTVGVASIEWTPDGPPARWAPGELDAYRAGRDAALAELAREIGGRVALLEVR